jgi:hypothetical protein
MKENIRLKQRQAEMRARYPRPETALPVELVNDTWSYKATVVEKPEYSSLPTVYSWPCKVHLNSTRYKSGHCSECSKAYRRAYHDAFKHRPDIRYNNMRSNAKRRGLEFDITFGEYCDLVQQPCFYALNWTRDILTGIDRLDSTKGYISGNCVPCCGRHNLYKSDFMSAEQTKMAVGLFGVTCGNCAAGRKKTPRTQPRAIETGMSHRAGPVAHLAYEAECDRS